MKHNKVEKKLVRYAKDAKTDTNDDGELILLPEFTSKEIVTSHTKRYHNCLYLLAGLNPCSRDLMDFITEEMDDENVISTHAHFRKKFSDFVKNTTNSATVYNDSTIKKALTVLFQKKLIRKERRGYSVVNSEYFIKNDEKNRLKLVKLELQFQSGYDTKVQAFKDLVEQKKKEDKK